MMVASKPAHTCLVVAKAVFPNPLDLARDSVRGENFHAIFGRGLDQSGDVLG